MKFCKLIMVSANNNNKEYIMQELDDSTFKASWGRVGNVNKQSGTYPMRSWESKKRSKIRKGYEDVTELMAVIATKKKAKAKAGELDTSDCTVSVQEIIEYLQIAAKKKVADNYNVEVKDVTQAQIDRAQYFIDTLVTFSKKTSLDWEGVNEVLLKLYVVIPRKMRNTNSHLTSSESKMDDLKKRIASEQELIDTMQGQVMMHTVANDDEEEDEADEGALKLKDFNLDLRDATPEEIKEIADGTDFDTTKGNKILRVTNLKTEKLYQDYMANDPNASEKLMYHGSRNENWWSILTTGLLIRPTNAIINGKMFGFGIYGADLAKKSIGYTSHRGSYWARGNATKAYLAIFAFNMGREWKVIDKRNGWQRWMSKLELSRVRTEGFDTVYAEGGADLRNNEYIVYEEERCTIKYLIELT